MVKQLNDLIKNFLLEYSFNNIDILLSERALLKLDADSLLNKLITRKRGGYCFENNQYFYNYLKDQGYDVTRFLGRVVYGGSSNVPRTHQMSVVNLKDQRYLVDVGFGPYTPGSVVPFDGSEVQAFNGNRYRLLKLSESEYQLEILKLEEIFSLYQFDLSHYNDSDFKVANYYTNTHSESKFTTSLILSQLTSEGVAFISDLVFTLIKNGNRVDQKIRSSKELIQVVQNHFNVYYSDQELQELYDLAQGLSQEKK